MELVGNHSHTMLQGKAGVWIYCYSSKKKRWCMTKLGADVIRLDQRKNSFLKFKTGNRMV
jgi:hypothetical protein